jgi:hypothetical protein
MSASPDELAATAARDFARTLAARRLVEGEHVAPARPMLDEVRSYLAGAPFANWAMGVEELAASTALNPKDRKSFRYRHRGDHGGRAIGESSV